MIPFKDFDLREQMYSFAFHDGTSYHWAIDRLRAWLNTPVGEFTFKGTEYLYAVPVDKAQADKLVEVGTVDEPRMAEITGTVRKPIIVAMVRYHGSEPKALIIDGNHTYVVAHRLGHPEVPAYVLPEKVWRKFLVDLPPQWERIAKEIVNPSAKL